MKEAGVECRQAHSVGLSNGFAHNRCKAQWVRYISTELLADYHHTSIMKLIERSLVCVEDRGRISRSCVTQDIKMGSCVFQCDIQHQWIAQQQVGPVSVYCDSVWCHVLGVRHGFPVWQHIGQSTTATSRHRRDMNDLRCLKATLNPNKQNNK